MKIKIYDDKKEKHQSWEAVIDSNILGLDDMWIEGYGRDKEEAIENLKIRVNEILDDLAKSITELANIDYEQYEIE